MKKNGFTLIELLVTMGIIAVLTGMAVFNFNQSRMRARDVSRKSDLGQLIKAMELYKNDNNYYPDPDNGDFQVQLNAGEYTKTIFNDPRGSEWQDYVYTPSDDLRSYNLMACLENRADSVRASVEQCELFPNNLGAGLECRCGVSDTGTMYVVSNP